MSDNNSNVQRYPDEDEISLVDLVAVLVRYRRMILGGTALVFVAAAALLFGPDLLGIGEGPEDLYTVTREFDVMTIPEVLENGVPFNPGERAHAVARDPKVVGTAYALIEEDPEPGRTQAQYNTMIQDDVLGELFETEYTASARTLKLTFRSPEEESARIFLDAIVQSIEEDLAARIEPLLADVERRAANRIDGTRAALMEMIEDAIVTDARGAANITTESLARYLNRTLLETFGVEMDRVRQVEIMRNRNAMLREVRDPLVTVRPAARGRTVRVVVSTMAALFLLIFVAFVRQYIRTVRANEEELRKLREAWDNR